MHIRVLEGRNAHRFISLYHSHLDKQYEIIQNDWKKMKSFKITNSGYDAYFGLSSSTLSQDAEFEVAEDATKSQIKSAFVKSLKTKKLNKKVILNPDTYYKDDYVLEIDNKYYG